MGTKKGEQHAFCLNGRNPSCYLFLTSPGKCFSLDLGAPNCHPCSQRLEHLSLHNGKVKKLLNCISPPLPMSQKMSHFLSSPTFPASLPFSPTQSLDMDALASLQG